MEVKDLPLATVINSDDFIPISQSGILKKAAQSQFLIAVSDGDKGDITVTSTGTVWTIDTGLPATKIADGSVSDAEFQHLSTVTSNVQTQLNAKAASADLSAIATSGAFDDLSGVPNFVTSVTSSDAGSDAVLNIVSLTQAEYDLLTPIATTLYVIVG